MPPSGPVRPSAPSRPQGPLLAPLPGTSSSRATLGSLLGGVPVPLGAPPLGDRLSVIDYRLSAIDRRPGAQAPPALKPPRRGPIDALGAPARPPRSALRCPPLGNPARCAGARLSPPAPCRPMAAAARPPPGGSRASALGWVAWLRAGAGSGSGRAVGGGPGPSSGEAAADGAAAAESLSPPQPLPHAPRPGRPGGALPEPRR